MDSNQPVAPSLRQFARALGLAVAAAGAAVLLGWGVGVEPLKSLVPGFVPMMANTAAMLLAAGLAVALLAPKDTSKAVRLAAQALAAFVVALALLTLVEHVSGRDLHIDQLLFRDPLSADHAGRVSVGGATAMLLVGLALLHSYTYGATCRMS